jgi:serine/threonine protein kinase
VAKGLNALHNCGIIHSDVKAENVLVCTDEKLGLIAKIADFGFSLAEAGDGARLPGGTVPWNAPEWLEWIPADKLSKTDIYSFGLLVWKVMTKADNPFQDEAPHSTSGVRANIDSLKASDARMLQTISSHLRRHLGQATEYAPTWAVIECTVRKDPQSRNLSKALEIIEQVIPEENEISP